MKRLLSIMLALMLVLSMAATAFAADTGKEDPTSPEAWLTKQYNDPVGRAATFSFNVVQDKNGGPKLSIADISFAADHPSDKKASQLVFDTPTAAGEFSYYVTENSTFKPALDDPDHEKMIMSKARYKVTISVVETSGGVFAINQIVVDKVFDDNGNPATGKVDAGNPETGGNTGFIFVNTYAKEAGSDDPNYNTNGSLTITKEVVDSTVDTEFEFKLTYFLPDIYGGVNPFTPTAVRSDGTSFVIAGPNPAVTTFTLKNGQSLKITGLPVEAKVSVTETAVAYYKPSVTTIIDGNRTVTTAESVGDGISIDTPALGAGENKVEVVNTYIFTPPTGVILNVLPYVLMVAIAGSMIVLFTVMKRRKAQDYED